MKLFKPLSLCCHLVSAWNLSYYISAPFCGQLSSVISAQIMPPKEPTRQQLSSRLAYSQGTPAFLQRLKNQVAGVSTHEDSEDTEFDEWQASSGRPPIPRRPSPPQRPEDDPGSANEDDEDEKPQIVVLKEGKHMSQGEVENERRRGEHFIAVSRSSNVQTSTAKGLPPLSTDHDDGDGQPSGTSSSNSGSQTNAKAAAKDPKPTLSFASFGSKTKTSSKKRKRPGENEDDLQQLAKKNVNPEKKVKKGKSKNAGALLSFDDGDEG